MMSVADQDGHPDKVKAKGGGNRAEVNGFQ